MRAAVSSSVSASALTLKILVHSRVLILLYRGGGLAIWDCSNLDSWSEILNLASIDLPHPDKARKKTSPQSIEVAAAAVLPSPASRQVDPDSQHPFIALVTRSISDSHSHSPASHLSLYSLRTHRIVSTVSLPGIAHRISTFRRFVVVSTTSPLALHVYRLSYIPGSSSASLEPAPFSPILNIAPPPPPSASDGPVFSLGSGGRLLAYSTSTAIPSSKLDRSPARPGTNILAHKGLFEPDLPNLLASPSASSAMGVAGFAVHEAPDVARRVGEGVMSGVNALRETGMSYWNQRRASVGGEAGSSTGGALSRSAPQQIGTMGRKMSSPTATRPSSSYGGVEDSFAGTVVVVDLLSPAPPSAPRTSSRQSQSTAPLPPLKVVHHFRPYAQSVAHLSFSPSSTSLLTSSSTGHHFDIFELKPAVPVGTSATSSPSTSASPIALSGLGKVWHRHRLQRGFTSATTVESAWSVDGRFVAVSTGKGTAHVYAVEPNGGVPNLEDHFQPQVANAQELPGLSVPLSSVARIRHPLLGAQASDEDARQTLRPGPVLPVSIAFLPKSTSLASSLAPSPMKKRDLAPPSLQDLLIFRPSLGSSTLYRLTPVETAPLASASESVARGDVGKLATTAVSGLTQMMKTRGAGLLKDGLGGLTRAPEGKETKKSWSVQMEAVAEWKLAREDEWPEVREEVLAAGESGRCTGHGLARCLSLQLDSYAILTDALGPQLLGAGRDRDLLPLAARPPSLHLPEPAIRLLLPPRRPRGLRQGRLLCPAASSPRGTLGGPDPPSRGRRLVGRLAFAFTHALSSSLLNLLRLVVFRARLLRPADQERDADLPRGGSDARAWFAQSPDADVPERRAWQARLMARLDPHPSQSRTGSHRRNWQGPSGTWPDPRPEGYDVAAWSSCELGDLDWTSSECGVLELDLVRG